MTPPGLSVIVVFRDMAREAPRTLFTLSEAYQRGVDPSAYEVIAVDAGSALPLDAALVAALIEAGGPRFTLLRTPPSPSPDRSPHSESTSVFQFVLLCFESSKLNPATNGPASTS